MTATSRPRLLSATVAIYLFWGSAYLAMRVGLRTLPPLLLAGTRLLLAGLLMGAYAWLRGARIQGPREWRAVAIAGVLLFLGGHGFLYWGQVRVTAGVAAVLFATIPLWMILIEGFSSTGIRLGWRAVSGLALGSCGVLLLVGPAALLGAGRVNLAGAGAVLAGSLFWAVGSIFCSKAALPRSAALAGSLEMLIGGALLVATAPLLGETRGFHWAQVSTASWLAMGYLILFASMIGFSCYLWLLKKASPARVSTYAYVTPLVAVVLGWALLHEAITFRTIGAIALLLSAVVLIVRQQSKNPGPLLAAEMESQGAVTP
ncbi:MAG: EamA family transporter [Terriglobales bacterium]